MVRIHFQDEDSFQYTFTKQKTLKELKKFIRTKFSIDQSQKLVFCLEQKAQDDLKKIIKRIPNDIKINNLYCYIIDKQQFPKYFVKFIVREGMKTNEKICISANGTFRDLDQMYKLMLKIKKQMQYVYFLQEKPKQQINLDTQLIDYLEQQKSQIMLLAFPKLVTLKIELQGKILKQQPKFEPSYFKKMTAQELYKFLSEKMNLKKYDNNAQFYYLYKNNKQKADAKLDVKFNQVVTLVINEIKNPILIIFKNSVTGQEFFKKSVPKPNINYKTPNQIYEIYLPNQLKNKNFANFTANLKNETIKSAKFVKPKEQDNKIIIQCFPKSEIFSQNQAKQQQNPNNVYKNKDFTSFRQHLKNLLDKEQSDQIIKQCIAQYIQNCL